MGQVVELEGAASAVDPGSAVALAAETSTPVSNAGSYKARVFFNNGEDDIWLRFATDGNDGPGTAIPIPAGSGLVVKEYHGALSAWCEKEAELHKAEF